MRLHDSPGAWPSPLDGRARTTASCAATLLGGLGRSDGGRRWAGRYGFAPHVPILRLQPEVRKYGRAGQLRRAASPAAGREPVVHGGRASRVSGCGVAARYEGNAQLRATTSASTGSGARS